MNQNKNRRGLGGASAVSTTTTHTNYAKATPDKEKIEYLEALAKSHAGADNKSQAARLREALSRYTLTTFEAMRYLDIYYPPARVFELRKEDENIITSWVIVETEQGQFHRVGLYSLGAKGVQHEGR